MRAKSWGKRVWVVLSVLRTFPVYYPAVGTRERDLFPGA